MSLRRCGEEQREGILQGLCGGAVIFLAVCDGVGIQYCTYISVDRVLIDSLIELSHKPMSKNPARSHKVEKTRKNVRRTLHTKRKRKKILGKSDISK